MARMMLPMLTEDPIRMDWVRARYTSAVSIQSSRADIDIQIDAPELSHLIEANLATWVADVRSPSTLYAETYPLDQGSTAIEFRSEDVAIDDLFIRTALVAIEDLTLPTSGLHLEIWGTSDLLIPAGTFLATGQWHASRTLAQSLLVFEAGDGLDSGTMGPIRRSGDQFVVPVAQDLYDRIPNADSRNIWMAALIAVFAYLGKNPPSEEDEDIVLASIRNRLQDASIPDWHDEMYDAARAATVLEQFKAPYDEGEENDD